MPWHQWPSIVAFGVRDVVVCDRVGILVDGDGRFTLPQQELAKITNPRRLTGTLADAMKGTDVFVGISAPNCVTQDMVRLGRPSAQPERPQADFAVLRNVSIHSASPNS